MVIACGHPIRIPDSLMDNILQNKQKKIDQGASGSVYVAKIQENAIYPVAQRVHRTMGGKAQVVIKRMDLRNQPRKELIVNEIIVMKESSHPNILAQICKCPVCQIKHLEEDPNSGYTELPMGMSNVYPSIGLQPMSNMWPMGDMNNVSPLRRGIGIPVGQMREEES